MAQLGWLLRRQGQSAEPQDAPDMGRLHTNVRPRPSWVPASGPSTGRARRGPRSSTGIGSAGHDVGPHLAVPRDRLWRGRVRLDETRVWCVFQLILGITPTLGNDSLLDAVGERVRNDALRSDIFDGFDRRLLPRRSPKHEHRYIHAAPARPRRARRLGHTYASRVAVRNRPATPCRSASPDEARRRTFAPSAAG